MATFAQAWNQAFLDVPAAGALQVRQWAQNAYKRLHDARQWAWRIRKTAFLLEASREPVVGVTYGSATVTSAALFLAADLGRQLRVGTYPVYTIITFTNASTVVLDRPYEGTTDPAAESEILSAFVTTPANFSAFQCVVDLVNQVRIGHWYTQEQLSLLDPTRTNAYSGPIRGLFSAQLSPSGGTIPAGRVQYEAWPYTTTLASLPYSYFTRPTDLLDADELPGVLRDRPDVLALGAKYEAAMWPGTPSLKNPYFNLTLAETLGRRMAEHLDQMAIRDDDQFAQDYTAVSWMQFPLANLAPTADFLRHTDSPAWAAYNGGLDGYY